MLMRFETVERVVRVYHSDTDNNPTVLRSHESFYGVPFSTLHAATEGILHVDEETFACEILQPGDLRLTEDVVSEKWSATGLF